MELARKLAAHEMSGTTGSAEYKAVQAETKRLWPYEVILGYDKVPLCVEPNPEFIPPPEATGLSEIDDKLKGPQLQAAEPQTQAPVTALAVSPTVAQVSPVFSMPKSVLIDTHEHHWPTIRDDLKNASSNGLEAAKAGLRGWYETRALEWARAKGKLNDADSPAGELAKAHKNMASLPTRRRTL